MEQKQLTIVIGLVVNEQGEILLAKRNQPQDPEAHNKWEFPGGKIEFGEDAETAVVREIKEETGLTAEVKRLLPKIYDNVWRATESRESYQVLILSYECKHIAGSLTNKDPKIAELKYFPLKEIDYNDCLPKMKEIINLLKTNR